MPINGPNTISLSTILIKYRFPLGKYNFSKTFSLTDTISFANVSSILISTSATIKPNRTNV